MIARDGISTRTDEYRAARERLARLSVFLPWFGMVLVAGLAIPAALIGAELATGTARYLVAGAAMAVMLAPIVLVMYRSGSQQQETINTLMDDLERELNTALDHAEREAARRTAQVRRQEFETRLANALEMAEGETEVIDVVERAFMSTLPASPTELLLADNSHAHLSRMAVSSPTGDAPMCGVDSPDHCPAARRAQIQRFADSEALDACPKLRGRAVGSCSAVCVPVSIMGRTVGVVHATGERDADVRRGRDPRSRDAREPRRGAHRAAADGRRHPAPGRDRQPHRSPQPAFAREPGAPVARRRHRVHGRDGRPRPLQGAQRHLRARDRRPRAAALRADAQGRTAQHRPRVPPRRRGVRRRPARLPRPRRPRGDAAVPDEAHQRGPLVGAAELHRQLRRGRGPRHRGSRRPRSRGPTARCSRPSRTAGTRSSSTTPRATTSPSRSTRRRPPRSSSAPATP